MKFFSFSGQLKSIRTCLAVLLFCLMGSWHNTAAAPLTRSAAATSGISRASLTIVLTEDCSDGIDNDGDGMTDGADPDCDLSNQPPSANAGSDQNVNINSSVTLNGSGSDPEGDTLSYQWTQTGGTAVSLIAPNSTNANFTAPSVASVLTFHLTVTDPQGASTSDSVQVTVNAPTGYNWAGFFAPVENLPAINTVTARQAIPIKFSLGGDFGLDIFASGYPKVQNANCNGSRHNDHRTTLTPANGTLQYNAATQSYQFVWKTEKSWEDSCRRLIVKLNDGSEHSALFKFREKGHRSSAEGEKSEERLVEDVQVDEQADEQVFEQNNNQFMLFLPIIDN